MIAKLMTNDDDGDVADNNVSNGDIVLTGYLVTSKSGLIICPTPFLPCTLLPQA